MRGEKEPLLNWLMRFLNRWEGMEVEWKDGSRRPFSYLNDQEKAEYLIEELERIYRVQTKMQTPVGKKRVLAVPGESADGVGGEGGIGEYSEE